MDLDFDIILNMGTNMLLINDYHNTILVTKGTSSETETVYFRFRSKGEEWVLFRVELRLVLKPGAAEPDHIFIQFTLAKEVIGLLEG